MLRNPQIIRNSDNAKSSVTMQLLENLHVNAGMLNEKKKWNDIEIESCGTIWNDIESYGRKWNDFGVKCVKMWNDMEWHFVLKLCNMSVKNAEGSLMTCDDINIYRMMWNDWNYPIHFQHRLS